MFWGTQRKVWNFFCEKKKKIITFDKNDGNQNKIIDHARFMARSWSNVVDNLAERIQKIKCKDCVCFLEYENVKLAINIIRRGLIKN